ncbi:MAG TPA: hypothetical protein VMZ52_15810 [Bryobacteraceae bacterium]|nr:hypothetical protein [Bryobacteraceae bacterium]
MQAKKDIIHLISEDSEDLPWCNARKTLFRGLRTRTANFWDETQISRAAADQAVCPLCVATARRVLAIAGTETRRRSIKREPSVTNQDSMLKPIALGAN